MMLPLKHTSEIFSWFLWWFFKSCNFYLLFQKLFKYHYCSKIIRKSKKGVRLLTIVPWRLVNGEYSKSNKTNFIVHEIEVF